MIDPCDLDRIEAMFRQAGGATILHQAAAYEVPALVAECRRLRAALPGLLEALNLIGRGLQPNAEWLAAVQADARAALGHTGQEAGKQGGSDA